VIGEKLRAVASRAGTRGCNQCSVNSRPRNAGKRPKPNLIEQVSGELRIPLVGVGIRETYLVIRSDDSSRTDSCRSLCPMGTGQQSSFPAGRFRHITATATAP
jgi:hypothetical protein